MDTNTRPAAAIKPASLINMETWVFDLDNTLYCGVHGLFEQIDRRMKAYLATFLDIDEDAAFRVQKTYFRDYGTTLRGMMLNHKMDPGPYLDFVHDIDISAIPPAPELDAQLARIPGRKVIFTNADMGHVERVLNRLGIADRFDGVFDILAADFVPKPEPEIYARMVGHFAIEPTRAVMVEDIARNLVPAAQMGMGTVWVRPVTDCDICKEEPEGQHVDFQTDDLTQWLSTL